MLKLNLSQLKQSVNQKKAGRPDGVGPGGWKLTGSKQIVRDHLPAFDELKAAGATWVEIAAGLAAQGVIQGDNKPITSKRLTALVSAVRKEAAKKKTDILHRAKRTDVIGGSALDREGASDAKSQRRLSLSPDLTKTVELVELDHQTEDQIRRANFEKHNDLFGKE